MQTQTTIKPLLFSCFINKEIEVKVTSEHRLQFLTYLIVARGKICESKTITPVFNHSNGIENMYKFSVLPTFEYAPKMKIIVFYVKDRTIVSATVTAKLLTEFKNFIELDVSPNTANPSDRVDIYVKSNPKSFIGLLGVDKSTTILRSGNDLIEDKVWEEFEKILQPKVKPSFYSREITKMCWQDFVVSQRGICCSFFYRKLVFIEMKLMRFNEEFNTLFTLTE